jgi:hypothetical protein
MDNKNYTTEKDGKVYDNCVLCGNITPYLTNQHIDTRFHYVEGSGQLCQKCDELTSTKNKK